MTTLRAENDVEDAINRYIRHCKIGIIWINPFIRDGELIVIPVVEGGKQRDWSNFIAKRWPELEKSYREMR